MDYGGAPAMASEHSHPRPALPQTEDAAVARIARSFSSTFPRLSSSIAPGGITFTVDLNDGPDDIGAYDAYRNGGFGAVPASGEAIASLPEKKVGESQASGKAAECAVCLEGYETGEALRTMPCSHGFHESCILRWLGVSRLCPLCRFALPAEAGTK